MYIYGNRAIPQVSEIIITEKRKTQVQREKIYMDKMEKIIIKGLITAAAILLGIATAAGVNYLRGYSLPHEIAVRMQELYDQGYSQQEISRICEQEFPQYFAHSDDLDLSTAEGTKEYLRR